MQKLLIFERDTKEQLQQAILKHLEGVASIQTLSVLEQTRLNFKKATHEQYYEAWVVINLPDNPNKNHDLLVGFEST